MRKTIKRTVSILLSVLLTMSAFYGSGVCASAADDSYDLELTTVLSENFDNLAMSSIPEGWESVGLDNNTSGRLQTWRVAKSYNSEYGVNNNTQFLFHSELGRHDIILPAKDLSGYVSASLSFRYMNPIGDGGAFNALTVRWRVDGGEWTELFYAGQAQAGWTPCTIELPADVLRENVEFAFYTQGYEDSLYIPHCLPRGVAIDDLLLTGESVRTHAFGFSAVNNVLTATCVNEPCSLDAHTATLTLCAPEADGCEENASANMPAAFYRASLNGADDFCALLDADITVGGIEYCEGETELNAPPTTGGVYTAKATITINGTDYVLTQTYTICHAVTYVERQAPTCTQDGNIRYAYCTNCGAFLLPVDGVDSAYFQKITEAETVVPAIGHTGFAASGSVLTMTCGNENCPLENHTLTLTLDVPQEAGYADADPAPAILRGADAFSELPNVAIGEIEYYQGDTKLDGIPTAADNYTAKVTVIANGTNYVLTKNYIAHPAASVTANGVKTYYATLEEAQNAWTDGSTLTLRDNVRGSITAEGGTKTFDLNGFGITGLGKTANIDINNYTIRGSTESAVTIRNCDLTIIDSDPTGKTHYGDFIFDAIHNRESTAATNINEESGAFSFTGGYITSKDTKTETVFDSRIKIQNRLHYGGSVKLISGTCTMNGGTVLGTGLSYGAVEIYDGTFTQTGGQIRYNAAQGGVTMIAMNTKGARPTFVMTGGEISDNDNPYDVSGITYRHTTGGISKAVLTGGEVSGSVFAEQMTIGGDTSVNGACQADEVSVYGSPTINGAMRYMNRNPIVITGPLSSEKPIPVSVGSGVIDTSPCVFTDGWSAQMGNADFSGYFTANCAVRKNADGELELYDPALYYGDVVYDAGEGSGTMDGVSGAAQTILPENRFTAPEGKLFVGWSDGAKVYQPGEKYSLSADVTFTAQWVTGLTVTFQTKGGSAVASQLILPDTAPAEPAAPVKAGFVFSGWLLNGDVYDFSAPVSEDITLTAVWIEGTRIQTNFTGGIPTDWRSDGWDTYVKGSGYVIYNGEKDVVPHSGNAYAYHPNRGADDLILPAVDLSGCASATLRFWYQLGILDGRTDALNVRCRVNGGEWQTLFRDEAKHTDWTAVTLALPADVMRNNVEISFCGMGNGGGYIFLDDVDLQAGGHSVLCSADGHVLTATCGNSVCLLDDYDRTITLCAPEKYNVSDGKSEQATVSGMDAFRLLTGAEVTVNGIEYYSGGEKLAAAPTAVGSYTAKAAITVNGTEYILTRDYTIRDDAHDQQSVTIDDQISVNFLLDLDARKNVRRVLVAYVDPETGTVQESAEYTDFSKMEKEGKLYKLPAELAPAQIGDTIRATIQYGDDETQTLYTSVALYCDTLLKGTFGQSVKDLAAATLEYGQAANDYFAGIGFCEAAEIGGTIEAQAAVGTVKTMKSTLSVNADGKIESASFMALTKPEFRFYVQDGALTEDEAAALNSKITVSGRAAARFIKNADTGAILLEVTGIEAADMGQLITVTIDGFGTITFSGNDFARMLASNAATAVLGAALYNYGEAARACFHA